jgi:hypothetical protein
MVSDESYHQALEQIQNIIDRQASNSFKIKGWTVTLVVVALLFRTSNFQLLIAFIPLLGFWYLDSYYLKQEKIFRKIYDRAREGRPENEEELFNMNPSQLEDNADNTVRLMFTKSILLFYGTIGVLLLLYSLSLACINGGSVFG